MEGKIRVLAIMTGVKSAQILGTRQSYKTMVQEIEPSVPAQNRLRCPRAGGSAKDQTSGGGVLEWVG